MNDSKGLKIKLFHLPGLLWNRWWEDLFPPAFLPYGMGIITGTLRVRGYYVEQDDLLVKVKFHRHDWKSKIDMLIHKICVTHFQDLDIFDPLLNQFADEVLGVTSYDGFDVIGFSVMSYSQFVFALLLAKKIKQMTGSIIVFGGAFITLEVKSFFQRYDFIDFMIEGDGEEPFLKLLDALQGRGRIEEIPSLFYKDKGIVKVTSRKHYPIEDMSLPDFNGLQMDLYKNAKLETIGTVLLPYQISRGCPHQCSFCGQRVFNGVSMKSFDKVIKELKEYSNRYHSNNFVFCDSTLNISYNHINELCDALIKNKLNIRWKAGVRVDSLDVELLKKMKKSGCERLIFGIESGSDKILKLMRKGFSVKEASMMLKLTHAVGIKVYIALIVGFPHEIQADVDKTIRFIKEHSRYISGISWLSVFQLDQHSTMYNYPKEFKLENLRPRQRIYFAFDETGGLKWQQKRKQQRKSYYQVLKVVYYNIFAKYNYRLFMPFWFWLRKKKYTINNKVF